MVAPTAEPLQPVSLRRFDQRHETSEVAADAEVVEVSLEASRERGMLLLDREVSMAATRSELPIVTIVAAPAPSDNLPAP